MIIAIIFIVLIAIVFGTAVLMVGIAKGNKKKAEREQLKEEYVREQLKRMREDEKES